MKQIFTLLSVFVFAAFTTNAQIIENFENYTALSSNCWQLTATREITGNEVISNAASIGTHATDTSLIKTPYLAISGLTRVSFKYLLNNKLNNNSERIIEVGTTDKNGIFLPVSVITLTKHTAFGSVQTFDANLALPVGVQRLTIRVTAKSGDGNSFITFDDLSVTGAAYHYGVYTCNAAPLATDAIFHAPGYAPFNGSLVSNASDDNAGETLTFSLDTIYSASGTLNLRPDGTFTFTPAGNFTGGMVSFTYKVTDNGYDPLESNVATVSITYPNIIPLAVTLTSFSGTLNGSNAQLSWTVAQNEMGNQFVLEKSRDGKMFSTVALVMTTGKAGLESYAYTSGGLKEKAYFRLKIVGNNSVVTYSRTILLQEGGENNKSNLTLLQNPVTSAINVEYTTAVSGVATVHVYTFSGVKVFTTQLAVQKGKNTAAIKLNNNVVPGWYVLELVNSNERSVAKLVKQ